MKTENEIIAEFMGLQVYQSYSDMQAVPIDDLKEWAYVKHLEYDKQWNWIMPVVEKIGELCISPAPNYRGYKIEIVPNGYVRISGFPMPTLTTNVSIEGSLIAAVYRAVVEFIKLYNVHPK